MRRPAPRALVVAGSGLLLMTAGGTAQAGWLFVLAAGAFALVGASYVFPHRLGRLGIERETPRRARVGDEIRVLLSLRNEGSKTIPMLRVDDHFPAFEPIVVASEAIPAGQRALFESVRTSVRRGDFEGGETLVTSAAPFGMGRSRRSIPSSGRLTVVPRWVELGTFPLLEPSSSPAEVLHERARTGAGEEYLGVREYRAGDHRRSVHWRTSARMGKLVVREFEENVVTRVALIVGGTDAGDPPDSAFEAVVSATASIALYALNTGHPVELFSSGPAGIDRLSSPGRADVLDRLARVQPSPWDPMEAGAEALRAVRRRGTIVFCATMGGVSGDGFRSAVRAVQAAGARVIVVVARSSSWDPGLDPEDGAIDRLRGGRSIVRVLSKGEELAGCLQGS